MPTKKAKILIIKLGAIGDVLMTTPALRLIKKTHPKSTIHYLVGNWSHQVLENNPLIDQIIVVDDALFYERKLSLLAKLFWKLYQNKYECIYFFHRNKLLYLFFSLIKGKKISFIKWVSFLKIPLFLKDFFQDREHHIKEFLRLVDSTNFVKESKKLDFFTGQTSFNKTLKQIKKAYFLKKKEKNIFINPGGGSNPGESVTVRRWPKEMYIDFICDRLKKPSDEKEIFFLVGGKADESLCEEIKNSVLKQSSKAKMINLCAKLSLKEFSFFLKEAHVFLTGDTGGMHLAASMDVPIISIFGPTDPKEKAPLSHNSIILESKITCSPCYQGKFKGCKNPICMQSITVKQVSKTCDLILNKKAS